MSEIFPEGIEVSGFVRILDNNSRQETIELNGEGATIVLGFPGKNGMIKLRGIDGNDHIWLMSTGDILVDGNLHIGSQIGPERRTFNFYGEKGDIEICRNEPGRTLKVLKLYSQHPTTLRTTLVIGTENGEGLGGQIIVKDFSGHNAITLDGCQASIKAGVYGSAGDVFVGNGQGEHTIHLNGQKGDIILQNADCAEDFDICREEKVESGMVMVIGEKGKLFPCNHSYDKKVAGIVSGAKDNNPGIILGKKETKERRLPIALNGRVFCKVDAQYSAIEVGDLLTTSPTIGHAMLAKDPLKAFGAVIGKALQPLKEGQDLIPIMVALH